MLVATGATIGIRETRRIVGEYRLTVEDYFARRSFDDEILRNAYYLDVHYSRKDTERYAAGKFDWKDTMKPYGPGESHGVPYRCLISKSFENVLVAGRCLSADRPRRARCAACRTAWRWARRPAWPRDGRRRRPMRTSGMSTCKTLRNKLRGTTGAWLAP